MDGLWLQQYFYYPGRDLAGHGRLSAHIRSIKKGFQKSTYFPLWESGALEEKPMRALCGAIITAGALIGLGLTALGYGIRYGGPGFDVEQVNPTTKMPWGASSLTLILVVLLIALFIGLGTAFLGLAFHHFRRYQEHERETGRYSESNMSS
jgi:hypothetical protein